MDHLWTLLWTPYGPFIDPCGPCMDSLWTPMNPVWTLYGPHRTPVWSRVSCLALWTLSGPSLNPVWALSGPLWTLSGPSVYQTHSGPSIWSLDMVSVCVVPVYCSCLDPIWTSFCNTKGLDPIWTPFDPSTKVHLWSIDGSVLGPLWTPFGPVNDDPQQPYGPPNDPLWPPYRPPIDPLG